jgi:hypothetical protein
LESETPKEDNAVRKGTENFNSIFSSDSLQPGKQE